MRENRPYNAHITLARFQPESLINTDLDADKRGHTTQINADGIQINADAISVDQRKNPRESAISNQHESSLAFYARSMDLMESHLKRAGAEYEILSESPLL